jgi:hypothetical protein
MKQGPTSQNPRTKTVKNKKGLSDVVTTLLIILVAVAAVARRGEESLRKQKLDLRICRRGLWPLPGDQGRHPRPGIHFQENRFRTALPGGNRAVVCRPFVDLKSAVLARISRLFSLPSTVQVVRLPTCPFNDTNPKPVL